VDHPTACAPPGGGNGDAAPAGSGTGTGTPPAAGTTGGMTCPNGETPTFDYANSSPGTYGASGVGRGPGGPSMKESCASSTCGPQTVQVDVPSGLLSLERGKDQLGLFDAGTPTSQSVCVAPPPDCPSGKSPAYIPGSDTLGLGDINSPLGLFDGGGVPSTGSWHCVPQCDVIVQYGGLYGFRSVCAAAPPTCAPGQTATFSATTEEWVCGSMCDGGQYDPVDYQGTTVCVPC
jgi:hypothetical protein